VLVRGAQCYGRLPSLLSAGRSWSLLYCHALATCPAAWFSLPTVWMYLDLVTGFFACWGYGLIWYTRGRGIFLMGIEARGALQSNFETPMLFAALSCTAPVLVCAAQWYTRRPTLLAAGRGCSLLVLLVCLTLATSPAASFCVPTV